MSVDNEVNENGKNSGIGASSYLLPFPDNDYLIHSAKAAGQVVIVFHYGSEKGKGL
jgi:hypothetical protein